MSFAPPAANVAFGPYRILALLAQGGGGVVYSAWDPRLQREVALKVLHPRRGLSPARAERFVAEARAASALNHPNIVTVFDAAFDGETPYIVSELIDGRTLRHEIATAALPLRRVLDLAAQIADGLAAAHEAGIVHRDLKPENIMLTKSGRVKIVDFGLAQPGGSEAGTDATHSTDVQTETDAGLRAGTVPYMSPEQARGMWGDFRSDQFSFGLVLFEMAAGHPAFKRDTAAATLDAILNDEPPARQLVDRAVPPPYQWIVERCLAKNASERYASTTDLHRDLATLRDRFGEVVAPHSLRPAPSRTSRWPWLLLGAALAATVVAGVLLTIAGDGIRPSARNTLVFAPLTTEPGYEGMPAWSPDGQTIAYVADVDGTLQVFTRQRTPPVSAQITRAPYDCRYPFWSPDGKRLYFISLARERESLWSISAAGGTPRVVLEHVSRAAISPDASTIAFLRDEHPEDIVGAAALWLWTASGGERRYQRLDGRRFIEAALLSPMLPGAQRSVTVKRHTKNATAHELYLKGRFHLFHMTDSGIETGVRYFERAVEADPTYALAYVGLAHAYRMHALSLERPPGDVAPKAKAAALKAVELDDGLAEAHAVLAFHVYWFEWAWTGAQRHFTRALELDPNSPDTHWMYAHLPSNAGRHADALAAIARARALDPLSGLITAMEGQMLLHAGRTDEAIARLRDAIELEPRSRVAHLFAARAFIIKGLFDEAAAEAKAARASTPANTQALALEACANARRGRRGEAEAVLAQLLQLSKQQYVSAYHIAIACNGLDDRGEAIAWLERGFATRDPMMVFLNVEPTWHNLRREPRFRTLLQQMKFV